MSAEIVMRKATVSDAERITALHVASWRSTYRGVLPDAYLDGNIETERAAHWRTSLETLVPEDVVLLATSEGELCGFLSLYWRKEAGFDAYLDNLHVRPGQWGGGIGPKLLAAGLRRMIDQGAKNLCLWVFDQNEGAVRFYERLGGQAIEHGIDDFANANAPHTKVAWSDLPAFLAACERA